MGSDVGQIFPTANIYRDHSILYGLVCEKELSHMGKTGNLNLVCKKWSEINSEHFGLLYGLSIGVSILHILSLRWTQV